MINAIFVLKNQSVASPVRPYVDSGVITPKEHDALHSSRLNSESTFPHTFLLTPVHEVPNDFESKIVAYFGGGFAWDYVLRNLLPENVEGIVVELQNTCNQSSLYEIVGHNAFYLGEKATKESTYNDIEVAWDLPFGTHPNYTTTPGHCIYSIVSNDLMCFNTIGMLAESNFLNLVRKACIPQYKISKQVQNEHSNYLCNSCSFNLCDSRGRIFHLRHVGSTTK